MRNFFKSPRENYLDADGKPTKQYLSLHRFQKALGVAPSMNSSGDNIVWVLHHQ